MANRRVLQKVNHLVHYTPPQSHDHTDDSGREE